MGMVLGSVLLGGVAVSAVLATRTTNPTIYACVKLGQLSHVQKTPVTCAHGYAKISWNQAGVKGLAGTPGYVQTVSISGAISTDIAASAGTFSFVGPTTTVTITATQRLTGSSTVAVGTASGVSNSVNFDICYKLGSGFIHTFSGTNFLNFQVDATRSPLTASGTTVPGVAGTYTVGPCIENVGTVDLQNNDYANTWIQVTN